MKVFILLYCRTDEDLPGNLLCFETVRTGFPEAEIHVFDNANPLHYRDQFQRKADDIHAAFHVYPRGVEHAGLIEHLAQSEVDDFYIIDPDTVWFNRMPDGFDAPLAGRLIPEFFDAYTGCRTFARLHTSCLYLSPRRIHDAVSKLNKFAFNGFKDEMFRLNGSWYRFDTCAKLFHALPESAYIFNDQDNAAFAHLFCGTHLSIIKDYYPQLADIHRLVADGVRDLQWLYREQDSFFRSLA